MSNDRFESMRQLRDRVKAEYLSFARPDLYDAAVQPHLFSFLLRKIDAVCVRSYFVHIVAGYFGAALKMEGRKDATLENEKFYDTQLPLIALWVMAIMYLENHILDGKDGTLENGQLDPKAVREKLIAGHFQKDLLYEYIQQRVWVGNPAQQQLVRATVVRIFRMVDQAQLLDKYYSSYAHYEGNLPLPGKIHPVADAYLEEMLYTPDHNHQTLMDWLWTEVKKHHVRDEKRPFVEFYFKRVAMENGALFVFFGALLGELLGAGRERTKEVAEFGLMYGVTSQFCNDNIDFYPSSRKKSTLAKQRSDSCADIRNDTTTLSAIFIYSNTIYNRNELLTLKHQSEEQLYDKIKRVLWENGRLFAQALGVRSLNILEKDNEVSRLLNALLDIADSDKFY